jgi:hypothetical protein
MTAREIARALAGRRAQPLAGGGYLIPCPLPSHGKGRGDRNPSLRIGDGQTRLLVHCYAGCDPRDVLDVLRRRALLDSHSFSAGRTRRDGSAVAPNKKRAPQVRDHADEQHRKAAWIWSQRRPIGSTIAETYLRQVRAITCPLPPTLAFLPPLKPEHSPAMIAAFALPGEIEPGVLGEPPNVAAVHLTLLRRDGSGKADIEKPKLIVGSPCSKPIVLAPVNDLLGLAITEGIETGLSVYASTGLGVWVAGSAARMPVLADDIPDYVKCVTINQEADLAGKLQTAKLARSLIKRGMEVRIAIAETLP